MKKQKQNISTGGYGFSVIQNSAHIEQPIKQVSNIIDITKDDFWKFGSDNLFPNQIAFLNRTTAAHGGIIERKSEYCTGKGFNLESVKEKLLFDFINNPNNYTNDLSDLAERYFRSYFSLGNVYLNVVTNVKRQFLNVYVKDYTHCRIGKGKDSGFVFIYPDWESYNLNSNAKKVGIFPNFTNELDGNLHSILVVQNMMEGFPIYGLPSFISALDPAEISKGINNWNLGRVKDGFSQEFIFSSQFSSPEEAQAAENAFKRKNGDKNAGKGLFLKKGMGVEKDDLHLFPRTSEGEFLSLRTASIEDLVIAHGWPRSLCYLPDNTGFDTKRILNEYEIARGNVIEPMQELFNTTIYRIFKEVLNKDITGQLAFKNQPPVIDNTYMRVWEYRKYQGLEFDEKDPEQTQFIFNINKPKVSASN